MVDPSKRASKVMLRMATSARQVCLDASGNNCVQGEGAGSILETLRNYSQPGTLGHVCRQVAKFSQYTRTGHTMGRYLLEYDILRREADAG